MLKNRLLLLLCISAFLLFPLSCGWEGGVEVIDNPDIRADMVFAGEDQDGNWATLAFRFREDENERDVVCFAEDGNGANGEGGYGFSYSYSYDKDANNGSIVKKDETSGTAHFTPGAFKLEANGSRLVFTDTGLSLLLVRNSEAKDLSVPFDVEPLPSSGSLDGTVWAATGFRTRDWTTLCIASLSGPNAGTISISHSFDASRFYRSYADYDPATGEGTLAYIGAFKIEGETFTFRNFYGHGGEVSFKRMR